MYFKKLLFILFINSILLVNYTPIQAQHSVPYQWSEVLLDGIRNDYARPTVHARNLFHSSVAMYDAWAILSPTNDETYLLGKTVNGFECAFDGISPPNDIKAAQEEAISHAMYTLMFHRFSNAPNVAAIFTIMNAKMDELGYDYTNTSIDYSDGDYAALGNYIGRCLINYGIQDGANEAQDYVNQFYTPVNEPLITDIPGNTNITNPDRWQPLTLEVFIDQSGNPIPINTPEFLSPEWGEVLPFSLIEDDVIAYERFGTTLHYWVDPLSLVPDLGPPSIVDQATRDFYFWNFSMVSVWSSHLDTEDGVMWDISPRNIGNNLPLPTTQQEMMNFYNYFDGGDQSQGYSINPATNQPYEPQIVSRADYARCLAEFWADGPESETPPGHWFTLLNYVLDHPSFEKRFEGEGPILDDLEYDVKSYFILGGTMHDVAIASWSVKGYYDYIRPISALRYMAEKGQSTSDTLPSYHEHGLPLTEGFIELINADDPLAIDSAELEGRIKIMAWKGHDYIQDTEEDEAGVGWILAEQWWPYQRPSFVTPPFAGYVSGHSTYSRAAAEVLTLLTGDEYFPGGMSEFVATQNEFLVFEDGPSQDIVLQWATYRDASDQCSLSRIWGGIHPPIDDIPGRFMGIKIGPQSFNFAKSYFNQGITGINEQTAELINIFPNPVAQGSSVQLSVDIPIQLLRIYDTNGVLILTQKNIQTSKVILSSPQLVAGSYMITFNDYQGKRYSGKLLIQ